MKLFVPRIATIQLAFLLLTLFSFGTSNAQTIINSGSTINASAIPSGNSVTINAGGTLNMDIARSFASVRSMNNGTSYISGNASLTVSGSVTIDDANTLSLIVNCTANLLTTTNINNTSLGISGGGTLTVNEFVFNKKPGNNDATFIVGAGTTLVTGQLSKGNGNVGTWNMTVNGTLKMSSSFELDNLTANTGSTIEYNGSSQVIVGINYDNLVLSGTDQKTLSSATTQVSGNLTITGSAIVTAVTGLDIGGNFTLGASASFTAGSYTHSIEGNWINNGGSFSAGTGTINLDGVNQSIGGNSGTTFNNLTTNGTGIKALGNNTIVNNSLVVNTPAPISIGNNTLTLRGPISGGGELDGSSSSNLVISGNVGTIRFNQSTPSSRSLNDLTLNNGSSAVLGSALDLYGAINLTSASLDINGQSLTLKSNASGTARIGNLTGSTLSGATNVTVERYIANPGKRAWHLLSPKGVSGNQSIFTAWQENGAAGTSLPGYGTLITSNLYNNTNGFDAVSNSASLLTHNQGGAAGPSWNYGLANTRTTLLSAYSGYMLFVRGDRNYTAANGPATSATTMRSTGTLTQGTQAAVTVSATGTGRTLVGNPYASPIDFENIRSTAHLDQSFYIWDPTLTGSSGVGAYRLVERNNNGTYQQTPTAGASNDALSRYIQSGQAVFMKATGSDANLVFTESSKATQGPALNPLVAIQSPDQQLWINLYQGTPGSDAALSDGMRVRYANGYSAATTDDLEKMGNFGENIASYRDSKKWIVEKRPLIVKNDTIFIRLSGMGQRKYFFSIGTSGFAQNGMTAFLVDQYLGSRSPISLSGNEAGFSFAVNADPASSAADRFMIVFGNGRAQIGTAFAVPATTTTTAPVTATAIATASTTTFQVYPSLFSNQLSIDLTLSRASQVDIRITDMNGAAVMNKTLNGIKGTNHFQLNGLAALPSGTYLVNVITVDGTEVRKVVKG